ncbi:MAG: hypothetical protein KC492_10525 [Myxococcales bacterium]|nr:hypothetical protein [Myxococcales bacterium]
MLDTRGGKMTGLPRLARRSLLLGSLLLPCVASSALAQTEACSTAACGKERFKAGVEAYQAQDYASAINHFRAALAVKRHPSILLNLGLAEIRDGQLLTGISHLKEVEADGEASSEMRRSARDERLKAETRTAWLQLDAGDGVSLEIDGQPAQSGERGTQLDPGKHQLKLTRGGVVLERQVDLSPGETLRVSLDRARELVLVMPGERDKPPGPQAEEPEAEPAKPLSPIWFYAGLGATLVVGGFATWSALDTQSSHDAYEKDLPTLTQGQINQRVEDGHGLERRTNWLLAGTAVLGVATGVLAGFFVDWQQGDRTSPHASISGGITEDGALLGVRGAF